MNSTFPHAYSKDVVLLVTIYQNLGTAEFYAFEFYTAAELEVSISRLWLLALSHLWQAHHFVPL